MKLTPKLHPSTYVFCNVDTLTGSLVKDLLCMFREAEGITLVMERSLADKHQLEYEYEAAWITLQLETELEMVGMTAEFSNALANEGISCNVIAAYHHDHLFVGIDDASNAMEVLKEIEL